MKNYSFQILLKTANDCHKLLRAVDHVVVGGLAVGLHGYERESRDVDFIVRSIDSEEIADALQSSFNVTNVKWNKRKRIERADYSWSDATDGKVRIDFRYWSEDAMIGEAPMPNPAQCCERHGLPVLSMLQLIENKLACVIYLETTRNPSRASKHSNDVGRLISIHELNFSYADNLHTSIRKIFCKLVDDLLSR